MRHFLITLVALFIANGSAHADDLSVASFNIQFVGSFKKRDNFAVAAVVKKFDIVVVQELVAPPIAGTYPDGTAYKADPEAKAFADAMTANGFEFVLSPEDTGTGDKNHTGSTGTEWFITFYKPDRVAPDSALPGGFLAADRTNNPDYERVPYAFGFKVAGGPDFVLVSVHLQPGSGKKDAARRKHELAAIVSWIQSHDAVEKDFVILGDMSIEDCEEFADTTPPSFISLNDTCLPTNTNLNGPKPYDHVMLRPAYSGEVERAFHRHQSDRGHAAVLVVYRALSGRSLRA